MNLREVKLSSRAAIPLALVLPLDRRERVVSRPVAREGDATTIDLVERREQRELERKSSANDPLYFYL